MRDAANAFGGNFAPLVDGQVFDQLGIVSYASDASQDLGLTTDFGPPGSAYESAIAAMAPDGWTNVGHALYLARTELAAGRAARSGAADRAAVGREGEPLRERRDVRDRPDLLGVSGGCAAADADAIAQATLAAQDGAAIYTIGLTSSAGTALLQQIADIGATEGSGGQFFDVDDPSDLGATFTEIANIVGFGLIE